MNRLLFLFHKSRNPIWWTPTSEAFFATIKKWIKKTDTIIEIGSGTGHVSYMLAKSGYHLTLNEIRDECLVEAQNRFEKHGVHASYISDDLFSIKTSYNFLWSSGLIQCFPDKEKLKLIQKFAKIAPKILLFYPDTNHPGKTRGANRKKIAGVDDAAEYGIQNIPTIMLKVFKKMHMGTLSAKEIGLPFPMYWVFGDNT